MQVVEELAARQHVVFGNQGAGGVREGDCVVGEFLRAFDAGVVVGLGGEQDGAVAAALDPARCRGRVLGERGDTEKPDCELRVVAACATVG